VTPTPAAYNDQIWLFSFFTFDGIKVAALSHTEYHGWAHPDECNTQDIVECEYDSDTFHLSTDGDYHFESFKAARNVVATVPYRYQVDGGPTGFSVDTGIIHYRGWYYAVATAWSWPPGCSNACLISGGAPIRTRDVFDPASWRAWSVARISSSSSSIPIWARFQISRNMSLLPYPTCNTSMRSMSFGTWMVRVRGAIFNLAHDPAGSYYAYFSMLRSHAPDRNFSVVGDRAFLYYVRLNSNLPDRVLFRFPIKLRLNR